MISKKKRIVFRADGSSKIGLGHIYRCLALIEILDTIFDCVFVIQKPSNLLKEEIINTGIELIELEVFSDKLAEANFLIRYLKGNEIVVLDGYNFDTSYQKVVRSNGNKVVVIDDINTGYFVSDILINHVVGINQDDVRSEDYTKKMLGPDFAILRKDFIKAAQDSYTRLYDKLTFFISMGGADLYNGTIKIVNLLLKHYPNSKYYILIGKAYKHKESLELFSEKENIEIHTGINSKSIVEIMRNCNIAICPASTISYEAMCLRLPIITGYISDFQIDIAEKLDNYGLAKNVYNLNDPNLKMIKMIKQIMLEKSSISDAQEKYFYGQQIKNLQSIFTSLGND